MVFGNMGQNSRSGIAFTRNPSTGEKEFFGEYLMNAEGEDIASGRRTPRSLNEFKEESPILYNQLFQLQKTLEEHYRDMQDLEFTIQETASIFCRHVPEKEPPRPLSKLRWTSSTRA